MHNVCIQIISFVRYENKIEVQESLAVARKPRDAEAILFDLKFANNIQYKLRCSQASIKQGFRALNIDCV